MVEFTINNPEDFTVYEFSNEDFGGGEAFGFTYLIGDNFYIGRTDVTAINIKTKEAYYCLEERKKATEYAQQLVGDWSYHSFGVATVVDDVIVYNLTVSDGNDIEPFTTINVAYRGEKFLGVLVIEYGDTGSKIIYEDVK